MMDNKPVVVLIDDAECEQKLLKAKFFTSSFIIFPVRTGKDGMKTILKESPDVIISDVTVPGGDIFWILKQLKNEEKTKKIPFIAFTTLTSPDDQKLVLKEGADKYVLKHECTPTKLKQHIKELLNKKNEKK
jgi:DNA-binding response OmpR family regulator